MKKIVALFLFLSVSVCFAQDDKSPTGFIQIDTVKRFVRSPYVSLVLLAGDDSGVCEMCLKNEIGFSSASGCDDWEPYKEHRYWVLQSGTGTRTVCVWFKDCVGNANRYPACDSIFLKMK